MQTLSRAPAAVLWDMDGTLVDTEPYWIAEEHALVERFGGTWTAEHAKALVGNDLRVSAGYIQEHGDVPLDVDEIVAVLLDGVVDRLARHVPWRPGAPELLGSLRSHGVPCALVTMSWTALAETFLAAAPARQHRHSPDARPARVYRPSNPPLQRPRPRFPRSATGSPDVRAVSRLWVDRSGP